jgi:glycosyltransferase involved in cell wall biosynthesis
LEFEPLLSDDYVQSIADERRASVGSLLSGYVQRIRRMLSPRDFDVLWVHADLLPYVPGFLEAAFLLNSPPIVYDCDDAIFHTYDRHRNPVVRQVLGRKMRPLLRRAKAATCGNDYLKDYVCQYCPNSRVVPTVVDARLYTPRGIQRQEGAPITIGWVGSPSTWAYVRPLTPVLRQLVRAGNVEFRAIGVGAKSKTIDEFEFVDWALESEVAEIRRFDIGIMPLTDDAWSRGKCGYKLIQYMASGLPVVASPVGVNRNIVRHGENGFLASTNEEWERSLTTLIADLPLRARMGAEGRQLVEKDYSLGSQVPGVAETLRTAAA